VRLRRAALVLVVAVAILAFFLAPVAFWHNLRAGPVGSTSSTPVYRSLGCATLGYGDLYAPGWFGFSLGCTIPVPIPL
jgi:hypothetical protein